MYLYAFSGLALLITFITILDSERGIRFAPAGYFVICGMLLSVDIHYDATGKQSGAQGDVLNI